MLRLSSLACNRLSCWSPAPSNGVLALIASASGMAQNSNALGMQPGKGVSPLIRPLDVTMPTKISELIPPLEQRQPTFDSLRTGLIAIKVGMVSEWDEYGVLTPLTVLWFDDNQVTHVKAPPIDCTAAIQIGCGSKKKKRVHRLQLHHYVKHRLPFKAKAEFKVSMDALVPVGTMLGASHFIAGQHVDITAKTKGKGFAGAMKRHGFKGQDRSHGHSLSHRSVGSIGAQGYSRVLPGKRMPGRMGGVKTTQNNCWVYRVDPRRNLLFVVGSIPGPTGGYLYVRDAYRKRSKEIQALPFPVYLGKPGEATQARPKKNKYHVFQL